MYTEVTHETNNNNDNKNNHKQQDTKRTTNWCEWKARVLCAIFRSSKYAQKAGKKATLAFGLPYPFFYLKKRARSSKIQNLLFVNRSKHFIPFHSMRHAMPYHAMPCHDILDSSLFALFICGFRFYSTELSKIP